MSLSRTSHGFLLPWRHWGPPASKVSYGFYKYSIVTARVPYATRQGTRSSLQCRGVKATAAKRGAEAARRSMEAAAAKEKVFVALPAELKAGRSTLSWALSRFGDSGATIVIAHVHVPPQMIPVMGVKFHASKLSPEHVSLFRRIEREKVDKLLDDYVHQCLKMKVKCEKLVFEKEDVLAGLVELVASHGVTKLVIPAASDRHYSRKMDKPKSRTATEIMQRADPSCKIWFVCKEQLICTRDKEVEIAPAITPLLPDFDHDVLHLSPHQEEDDIELELGFYDELKEACKAGENLMNRALEESSRCQKADEEVVSSLQKAKEYKELYLEEVNKRKELEGALVRTNREMEQLRQAIHLPKKQQNTTMEELQEAITKKLILEQRIIDMNADFGAVGQLFEPQQKEPEALLNQRKLTAFSPSSVIPSPFDEDCIPSYLEVMREPYIAADGPTKPMRSELGSMEGTTYLP